MDIPDHAHAAWRKSSYSGGNGASCVEVAVLDGAVAMRNSNHPDAGTLVFTVGEIDAWINGCKTGQFDDLA